MKPTQYQVKLWIANHWTLVFNGFFFTYAALPVLAPVLLAAGYEGPAAVIYRAYGFTCHQMPSHSHFIAGHQVAVCQRCIAIHVMLAVTGIIYATRLFRVPMLSFRWFLLFLIPMGIDGGMALVSELLVAIPIYPLWIIGIVIMAIAGVLLHRQNLMTWQVYLFFAAGPFSLLYIQIFGPHESNWQLRTITGSIYAVGGIWLIYPMLEESFRDLRREAQTNLARLQAS